MDASTLDRFMAKVDTSGECWLWTSDISDGYGRFWLSGKTRRAHRLSYEHFVGPVGEGLMLDHLCRVRRCVNPAHLEVVTNAENIRRGVGPTADNYRKTHCKRGHEFTAANTYVRPHDNGRLCRTCNALWARAERRAKSLGLA